MYVRHFRSTQEVAKIRRKTSSLLATRSILVIITFSYRFCPEDFSETDQSIFVEFSGLIDNKNKLIYFLRLPTLHTSKRSNLTSSNVHFVFIPFRGILWSAINHFLYSICPFYLLVVDKSLSHAPWTHPMFDYIHAHSVPVQKVIFFACVGDRKLFHLLSFLLF